MLRDAYSAGYVAAFSELPFALSKEADLKTLLRNLALTAGIGGSAVGGGNKLGRLGATHMAAEPQRALTSLIERKINEGQVVNTRDFLKRHAPSVSLKTPETLADFRAGVLKREGALPSDMGHAEAVEGLLNSPGYQGYKQGINAGFNSDVGLVAGEQANPTVLAHEIGHARQSGLNTNEANTFWSTLLGRQRDTEADAWGRARKNFKIDPEIEEASMAYYRNRHAGAAGGAVAGAGVGGGAAALSLLGLAELAARLKRRRP